MRKRLPLVGVIIAITAAPAVVAASPITPSAFRNTSTSATYDMIVAGLLNGVPWQSGTGSFGTFPMFSVGYQQNVHGPGQSFGTFEERPVMEFDLRTLGFDGTNAFLSLYVIDASATPGISIPPLDIGIYGYAGDGVY